MKSLLFADSTHHVPLWSAALPLTTAAQQSDQSAMAYTMGVREGRSVALVMVCP